MEHNETTVKFPESLQDYFDNMWNAFVVRREPPSMSEKCSCMYRSPSGARCGIGWSIPDELYTPRMESKPASSIIESSSTLDPYDLDKLQRIHDENAIQIEFYERVEVAMRAFAANHSLRIPYEPPTV
jgi:hypothetical protein